MVAGRLDCFELAVPNLCSNCTLDVMRTRDPWVAGPPIIVTIMDSTGYIRFLLYFYHTTIARWGVLLNSTTEKCDADEPTAWWVNSYVSVVHGMSNGREWLMVVGMRRNSALARA